MDGRDRVPQQQRTTTAGDERQRVESRALRWCVEEVEFQNAALRHAAVTNRVGAACHAAQIVAETGQEGTHA